MEYIVGMGTATVSPCLLYYFEVGNKVLMTKTISAHRAYHLVNRRRHKRGNLRIRSNSSKVNEAGVSASNTKLIDHYKELETGGRPKLKEGIQGGKVGTVDSKG